jgi:hypothetical protein
MDEGLERRHQIPARCLRALVQESPAAGLPAGKRQQSEEFLAGDISISLEPPYRYPRNRRLSMAPDIQYKYPRI